MRTYAPYMGPRPLFGFILMIAMLFASALTGTAAASAAAMPGHDMQMMEMGHCSSAPSGHDDRKGSPKNCCIAMCTAAIAVAPSAPAELPLIQQAPAAFPGPSAHTGFLGEIASPPPRLA